MLTSSLEPEKPSAGLIVSRAFLQSVASTMAWRPRSSHEGMAVPGAR